MSGRKGTLTGLLLGALILGAPGGSSPERAEKIDAAPIHRIAVEDEAITPVVAGFVEKALRDAERSGAQCVILVLDTPGGLVDATRDIVREILQTRVPVVSFVPRGGRAASAGVFIVQASHVAAMAEGAHMGAAHPVQIGGLPTSPPGGPGGDPGPDVPDSTEKRPGNPLEEKIVNDTTAWARSLAELRGRNADWAERAVRESVSVSSSEALRENAIDLLVKDEADLMHRLQGRNVTIDDRTVLLDTLDAEVVRVEMWWGQRVLAALSRPNIAFLLLIFGFYGLLFELYSPGWGVSGTLGALCLVLAFFALSIVPVNYAGVLLVVLGLALFVAEVFVTSFGLLTLGGATCVVLGGLMLVDSPAGFLGVTLDVVLPVAVATGLITFFLLGRVVHAHRAPVLTGGPVLLREDVVAVEDFVESGEEYRGTVQAHGELWGASCAHPVRRGERLAVNRRDGLILIVGIRPDPGVGSFREPVAR